MPTYDYVCDACGHAFELFQGMKDPVKKKCPECGALKLKRLIGTGAGVIFKGGGFYETDYRGESYKKAAEAVKKAAEGGGDAKSLDTKTADTKTADTKTAEKKTDAKPAKKTDAKPAGAAKSKKASSD